MTGTTRIFVAGLAAEAGFLRVVLPEVEPTVAQADGLVLGTSDHGPWAVALLQPGRVDGVVLDLDATQAGRLDFVLRSFGLQPHPLCDISAVGYVSTGIPNLEPTAPDVLAVVLAVVGDILALKGQHRPEAVAARLHPMLVRAASRLRAVDAPPASLRHDTRAGDVSISALRQPYAHFFAVEESDVSWRRFDGSDSATVTRAAFISGDAVTVLPYDPKRDLVLVIEQFRAGPLARGDAQLWQIEAIAGRVDAFETPEQAARREAVEEAGLTLTDLIPISRFYPSPGAVSEYIYSYLALTALPEGITGIFGVEGEAEDIRGHLISFDRLMEMVASGEVENAPLILTALWLQRERPRLRQDEHTAHPVRSDV